MRNLMFLPLLALVASDKNPWLLEIFEFDGIKTAF